MSRVDPGRPVLVFGGPYSNLSATNAMRTEADRLGLPASQIICTGDVVAYCAEPQETTAAIRDWGCHVVAGNCEEQLAEGAPDCGCGFEEGTACDLLAKGWYPYALKRISDDNRAWMGAQPDTLRFMVGDRAVRVVHGSTTRNNTFLFASDTATLDAELASDDADIIVAGHCGIPFIHKGASKVWFNPGVIGMPANDGTPDVWYGLMTPTSDGVKLSTHRLAYDYATAAANMRRWAYADSYATALISGIWPSFDVLPAIETADAGKRLRARSQLIKPRQKRAA